MIVVACTNRECPEHGIRKTGDLTVPDDAEVLCGACTYPTEKIEGGQRR